MMTQTFAQRTHEILVKGFGLVGLPYPAVAVRFDARGRMLGQAGFKTFGGVRNYFIRYNPSVIQQNEAHMLADVVPHEVAHIVIYELIRAGRSRDKGHGRDWKRICRLLGGNPEAKCNAAEIGVTMTKARRTRRYIYQLDSGRIAKVAGKSHNSMMKGRAYVFRDTGERMQSSHFTGRCVIE